MSDSIVYVVTVTLLVALSFLALWIARQSLGFEGVKLFQSRPRRLALVESTAIDGRRRLLLIRRDNVEHLIMTGGPIDVVVETGIPLRHLGMNGVGEVMTRSDNSVPVANPAYSAPDMSLVLQRDEAN